MRKLSLIMTLLLPLSLAAQTANPSEGPAWFKEEMKTRVGTWVTSNKAYQSEDEPYDSYGMEWKYGTGEMSMTGILYGMVGEKKTIPFWEFRTFWHPGDQKVYAYQYGWSGVFGEGEMLPHVIDQTFYNPDGTITRSGHKSSDKDDEHVTSSFDIDTNGEWKPRRSYTWKKQKGK